jgi:hypothetical protein
MLKIGSIAVISDSCISDTLIDGLVGVVTEVSEDFEYCNVQTYIGEFNCDTWEISIIGYIGDDNKIVINRAELLLHRGKIKFKA